MKIGQFTKSAKTLVSISLDNFSPVIRNVFMQTRKRYYIMERRPFSELREESQLQLYQRGGRMGTTFGLNAERSGVRITSIKPTQWPNG